MNKKFISMFHPERYQGWGKTQRYFEGWYFKMINADETKSFAIIPGVAMDKNGNSHSFIQVLDGKNRIAEYINFPITEFVASASSFEIKIGNNAFSKNEIVLNLPKINGKLEFDNHILWPKKWYSPGIMGPFSFVPFMECYHGILSMYNDIKGHLVINGENIDFSGGKGYIEKDWGQSFPSAYFWMQSNHFTNPRVSIKASIANIPWLGSSFVGFIAGVWLNDRLLRFTTYNGTKLLQSFADKSVVNIVLENKKYRLEIKAHRADATELASPISGFMNGRIEESMTSSIDVKISDKRSNKVLFEDTGRNAGLEVAGEIASLMK